ncbi:coenzyme F420-0:L-glutamate ligase [Streptomyces sp. NPDC085929]|uniref:coenzyme F420-0:L-glutamate ligase n=1 Tax=Streptomyces sp. NPDC085929 TaxID=3365739 RepID=UPI0037D571B4
MVVASKAVSIAEKHYVDLPASPPLRTPWTSRHAQANARKSSSSSWRTPPKCSLATATEQGPTTAWHTLGFQLVLAGINRAGTDGAWLLPRHPDASAATLRDALITSTGVAVAVVIAHFDGRADRRGTTVISIGAAGITPLRTSSEEGKDPDRRRSRGHARPARQLRPRRCPAQHH